MKKILTIAALAICSMAAQAQTDEDKTVIVDSKPWDNWYVGVFAGGNAKTTHNKWMKNLNAIGGARVGRWFTPCYGIVIDDQVGFHNRPYSTNNGTIVTYNTLSFGTTINFSNWFAGYPGEPRAFEVIGVPMLGWTHAFGNREGFASNNNAFTSKLGVDLTYNLGKKKEFQVYVEPAFIHNIYENGAEHFDMNVDRSYFQVAVGFNYKFKNTNGTHNFKYGSGLSAYAQDKINQLTAQYEAARAAAEAAQAEAAKAKAAAAKAIADARNTNAKSVVKTILGPVVIFKQNKSEVEQSEFSAIEQVADFMKQNPDARVEVKGYASMEGGKKINKKLSENRANAVADILVKKYGIAADRLTTTSFGATDKLSVNQAQNRVVTFSEMK